MKIKAKSIELRRAEGYTHECITVTVDAPLVWSTANAILHRWSATAPKDGSTYDKCDFKVTYEDGNTYKGRYDLKHYTVESPNLALHMEQFTGCYAGTIRPAYMTDEQWASFTERHQKEAVEYGKFIAEYEIGEQRFEQRDP